MADSFGSRSALRVGNRTFEDLPLVGAAGSRMGPRSPAFSLKNRSRKPVATPRTATSVTRQQIEAVARWQPDAEPAHEIAFMPARWIMQDFTRRACGGGPGRHAHRHPTPGRRPYPHQSASCRRNWSSVSKLTWCRWTLVRSHAQGPGAHKLEMEFSANHERYAFLPLGPIRFSQSRRGAA